MLTTNKGVRNDRYSKRGDRERNNPLVSKKGNFERSGPQLATTTRRLVVDMDRV